MKSKTLKIAISLFLLFSVSLSLRNTPEKVYATDGVINLSGLGGGETNIVETLRGLLDGALDAATGGGIEAIMDFRNLVCEPTKQIYDGIIQDQEQSSILRTHYFLTAAGPLNVFYSLMGVSIDELPRCAPIVGAAINDICILSDADISEGSIRDKISTIFGTIRELFDKNNDPDCDSINFLVNPEQAMANGTYYSSLRKVGPLASIAMVTSTYNETAPSSINMAYYINDSVSRIPVVGATLAADPDDSGREFRAWFLDDVIGAWKAVRNLAYGFLSVYLFYVGILIVTRKHVDQRTVVTVQYALPKLVIAVVLITFSYAIGAFFAEGAWYISRNAPKLVFQAMFSDFVDLMISSVIGFLLMSSLLGPLTMGWNILTITLALLIAGILFFAIIQIKFLLLYIKLVVAIIISPLQILLLSIPGSEKGIGEYFKKLSAYALGMIALRVIFYFAAYLGFGIMSQATANALKISGFEDMIFGTLFLGLIYPIVLIIGCIQAIKAPKAIETAILGKKRK